MFYLQLASASSEFLKWIQRTTNRLIGVQGKIQKSSRSEQLRFAKKETLLLFSKMYYSKNIPHLKRKFQKAQRIFEVNKKHNNTAQVEELVYSAG